MKEEGKGVVDIDLIWQLMADNPTWNRSRLSKELCERCGWHGASCPAQVFQERFLGSGKIFDLDSGYVEYKLLAKISSAQGFFCYPPAGQCGMENYWL